MSQSEVVKQATGDAPSRDEEMAQLLAVLGDRKRARARYSQLQSERNAEIAAREAAALTTAAEKQLVAIKKAVGSLVDQGQQDDARFIEAAKKFAAAAKTLNERFDKIVALRHEARSICEVFEWPTPDLAEVVVPAARPGVMEAFVIANRVGVRDNGYVKELPDARGGRSFEEPELAGTPGLALIKRRLGR